MDAATHPKRRTILLAGAAAVLAVLAAMLPALPAHAAGVASITGRVVYADGGIAGAGEVDVYYQRLSGGVWTPEAFGATTIADGTFDIVDLELGEHRIRLDYRGTGPYLDGWYDDDGFATALERDATAFDERDWRERLGDIRMLRPTAMQGRVTLPSGAGAQARVTATAFDPGTSTWVVAGVDDTDAAGDYVIPDLLNTRYRLTVENVGAGQYETITGSGAGTPPGSRSFTLAVRTFPVTGTVTGVDADGAVVPLPGFTVSAFVSPGPGSWYSVKTATVQSDGSYTLLLPPGTYRLHAHGYEVPLADDYAPTWRGGGSFPTATPFTIADAGASGLDLRLPASASISGIADVHPSSADPEGTMRVVLWRPEADGSWSQYRTVHVDTGETYRFGLLSPGTYYVSVALEVGGSWGSLEWWQQHESDLEPGEIVVGVGQAATGFDVVLDGYQARERIDAAYAELGGASGSLGAPTGPYTGDANAMWRSYAGGTVYASRRDGTWVVPAGTIRDAHTAQGGATGAFGWPVAAATCAGGVCSQEFAGGILPRMAPRNLVAPSVSGTTAPGSTLTVDLGVWSDFSDYRLAWLRCTSPVTTAFTTVPAGCTAIPGAQFLAYVATTADVGRYLTAQIAGMNAVGTRLAGAPTTAMIQSSPPQNTAAPTVSGAATIGATWTLSTGTWTGAPAPTFVQAWLRCTAPVPTAWTTIPAGCTAIPGARSTTYVTTAADAGRYLTAQVAGVNPSGTTFAGAASTTTLPGPTAPVNSVAPSVSGGTTVGSTWTLNPGTWSGSPTFLQAWLRCASPVAGTWSNIPAGCVAIPGARSTTYVTTAADAGRYLVAQVGAVNAVATVLLGTAGTTQIPGPPPPTAPVNTAAPTVSGAATVGSTWTLALGTWTGTPAPTYVQAWLRCSAPVTPFTTVPAGCVAIPGARGTTYTTTPADVGKYVTAQVGGVNSLGTTLAGAVSSTPIG